MKRIAFRMVMIVLVLALLANTALAATNWETLRPYFEQMRGMNAAGESARWSNNDKLKLLTAMDDASIVEPDASPNYAMDESNPLPERTAIADEIIALRYGADYFDSDTIERIELSLMEQSPSILQEYATK